MPQSAQLVEAPTTRVSLARWGVSAKADLVFQALTVFGPATAAELSRLLSLPRREAQLAIDELVEAGALHRADAVWQGRPAGEVVEQLRERSQRRARARYALEHQLVRLDGEGLLDAEVERDAWPLHGLEKTRARLAELVATERFEHLAMNPEIAFGLGSIRGAAAQNRSLVRRGVTSLTLGVPAVAEDASRGHGAELAAAGLQYRELPQVPAKLMILDRQVALLALDAADLAKGAWEIRSGSVVDRLLSVFFERWSLSVPPPRQWILPMNLTPREKAIVTMLADGHTDASVSEHLGLSVRTIAYVVSDLMERYGAKNRFQLGLLIGAESTLDSAPSEEGAG